MLSQPYPPQTCRYDAAIPMMGALKRAGACAERGATAQATYHHPAQSPIVRKDTNMCLRSSAIDRSREEGNHASGTSRPLIAPRGATRAQRPQTSPNVIALGQLRQPRATSRLIRSASVASAINRMLGLACTDAARTKGFIPTTAAIRSGRHRAAGESRRAMA